VGVSPQSAVGWYEQAVALRPFEANYRRELSAISLLAARPSGDAALLRQAHDQAAAASSLLNGRDAYVMLELARAALELDLAEGAVSDQALDYSERAIALDPLNPIVYTEAAYVAHRSGRSDRAREYWEAGQARARSSDAFHRLGEIAMLTGDQEAAAATFRQAALKAWRSGQKGRYLADWGAAAHSIGDFDGAIQAYEQVIARDPGDTETRTMLAEALAADGRNEEAIEQAREVLQRAPRNARAAELVEQLGGP
jgi:tetratricopeptide (TPR) repeat protein